MLTTQNIEAELSYAYVHAIAAMAGFDCHVSSRNLDDAGVDAVISEDGRELATDSIRTSFSIHLQLKATFKIPVETDGRYSFNLSVPRYDKLRSTKLESARFLVVLYLPQQQNDWLQHSEDGLLSKRCAYWASLRKAPDSDTPKYKTVYIPRKNKFSVETLTELMTKASRLEEINYET